MVIPTVKEDKFVKKIIKLEIPEQNDIENFWRVKDAALTADMVKQEFAKKRDIFVISFKRSEML